MADEDHTERLARGLCRDSGRDPDELVDPEAGTGDKAPYSPRDRVPAWTTYVSKAKTYVAAARALKMLP